MFLIVPLSSRSSENHVSQKDQRDKMQDGGSHGRERIYNECEVTLRIFVTEASYGVEKAAEGGSEVSPQRRVLVFKPSCSCA